MKNLATNISLKILVILLLVFPPLLITNCNTTDKKPTTVARDEDKLVTGQSIIVDNGVAKLALDSNTFYIVDINGDTTFTRDTIWHRYRPAIDTAPVINKPPIVNAGADQTITLPTNTITLAGFGVDPEGLPIASYKWIKLTGVGGVITNSVSATSTVTGLTVGTYSFRLAATDNEGAIGIDDISIIVNSMPVTTEAIEGYGSQVTGGNGYQVIHITDLSQLKSNIGSNRTLLIDVSGTLNGNISITNISNLTIDCYTTKQDVTITNTSTDGLTIENSNNILIRGLRSINNSGGANSDGFNAVGSSTNVVFDHCSAYGNSDGNIDLTATSGKNFTVQWCIMGNDKQSGNMLLTTINASIHHNLFVGDGSGEGAERNPFSHSNYSPKGTQANPNFDVRNNIINASGRYASGDSYGSIGNFINNYYTSNKAGLINLCADAGNCASGYVSGNYNQLNSTGGTRLSSECTILIQYRITTTDAVTAGKAVLASVGPYKKTSYEQGVISAINIGGTTPLPTDTTTVPPTTGYTLVYSSGYDDVNSIDPFGHGQWGSGTQADHLSTTLYKTGPGSFKSVPANVSSGIRSEVQYGSAQSPLEGIVEYDVYYDNFFANSGHSFQWHPTTSGGSGTGSYHENGKMQFKTVKSGTSGTNVGAPFSVSTKVWHHFKYTYKFGSSGYIKLELDGVVVVNANVQMGDGSAPYLKVGVNMWADQTSVVYYDNLKVYKKA